MKIKYLGHAAFELELASGARYVIDPYTAGAFGTLKYAPIEGNFDVAIVSHNHEDHVSRDVLSHSHENHQYSRARSRSATSRSNRS